MSDRQPNNPLESKSRPRTKPCFARDPAADSAHWLDLARHPASPSRPEIAVRVRAARMADSIGSIGFRLDGIISQILIAAPSPAGAPKQLWRHTCLEVFIAAEGRSAYHEFNFAPSGEWEIYAFTGYRDGGPISNEAIRPELSIRQTEEALELDAMIQLNRVSPAYANAPLRLGLAAVIEARDGLSYWALHHPTDKPDFHDPRGFAMRFGAPLAE
jgi:hypothetical protein